MPSIDHRPCSVCVNRHHSQHHNNNNNNQTINYNSNLFFVGTSQSEILIYDSRKQQQQQQNEEEDNRMIIERIGSEGNQPAQFNSFVYGICIDEIGSIWVTDYYNNRIEQFALQRQQQMSTFIMGGIISSISKKQQWNKLFSQFDIIVIYSKQLKTNKHNDIVASYTLLSKIIK